MTRNDKDTHTDKDKSRTAGRTQANTWKKVFDATDPATSCQILRKNKWDDQKNNKKTSTLTPSQTADKDGQHKRQFAS